MPTLLPPPLMARLHAPSGVPALVNDLPFMSFPLDVPTTEDNPALNNIVPHLLHVNWDLLRPQQQAEHGLDLEPQSPR